MVETRTKPHLEQVAEAGPEQGRRTGQRRLTPPNQVFGLLIVRAAIPRRWLLDTHPKWIFPPGWRRP
jgi:hypothetical protein